MKKKHIKMLADVVMLILLPLLMAEMLTGQMAHEWLGTGIVILFIVHHLLNIGWLKNLFKGEYTASRSLMAIINLLLAADVIALAVSGIRMSGFVFGFLEFSGDILFARKLHLFSSYWGMILMSVHLGLHGGMALRMSGKWFHAAEKNNVRAWLLRGVAFVLALLGIYAFGTQNIADYLLLRTHFVFFEAGKPALLFFAEYLSMIALFTVFGYYLNQLLKKADARSGNASHLRKGKSIAWKIVSFAVPLLLFSISAYLLTASRQDGQGSQWEAGTDNNVQADNSSREKNPAEDTTKKSGGIEDGFISISGGTFQMGSPEDEAWRSEDEIPHQVTVDSFYLSPYEVTQKEYQERMGENPSSFQEDGLPVENVSWFDAVEFCNAMSEAAGLTLAYTIDGQNVSWNRSADGYRLPTEAEWEYACRGGTETPFNTETSIGADEANYYGHYPYQIEENYFTQEKLDTEPGEYRETTVKPGSFSPNRFGLYDMHGNVSEWVWDFYGSYEKEDADNPTGMETGTRKVYRGGGWNDFAKNMRSAYRAALQPEKSSFNLGIRLARGAVSGGETSVASAATKKKTETGKKMLIAYFSWGGNTKGIAERIQEQTGADLFEIQCKNPYSEDYDTVLEQAQRDQMEQARPELAKHVENMEEYDTVLIGYPNWWASIPMPVASFLEEYDFAGKTILPFCSHGGGRFGQSLTAIAKLVPEAELGEGLSVHYSGDDGLDDDIKQWLAKRE